LFTISVETHFWASHQLVFADGSKEPLHGHNWAVMAKVGADKLDQNGLVMDFCRLKAALDEIAAELTGGSLNRIDYFEQNSCSAESVARYVFAKLEPQLPGRIRLASVRIVETPGCGAEFSK